MARWTNTANRLDNTVSTVGRLPGIVVNTGLDILDTFNNSFHRSAATFDSGINQARAIIQESGQGSFWKRLVKVPWGGVLATGKLVESFGRGILDPLAYFVRNSFDVVGNPLVNTGNAIKYMPSSRSASSYSYEKLQTSVANTDGRNRKKLLPRQSGNNNPNPTPTPTP